MEGHCLQQMSTSIGTKCKHDLVGHHNLPHIHLPTTQKRTQLVPRYLVPKPVDIKAAMAWGAVLGVGALWMVQVWRAHVQTATQQHSPFAQPFDWIKAQLNPPKEE